MGQITIPDESWREDVEYDAARQREVDGETEKRLPASARLPASYSLTEAEAAQAVQEALFEGSEAGRNFTAAGCNPYPIHTAQAKAWERGRFEVVGQLLARRAA